MDILYGIQNFLEFINTNWTTIIVILGLALAIFKKAQNYFKKSDEEKIEIAKAQIHEAILKMITDAEIEYDTWVKAGSIKRSQVIEEIFNKYPILSKVVEQDELIEWIDNEIDSALDVLREIIENKS